MNEYWKAVSKIAIGTCIGGIAAIIGVMLIIAVASRVLPSGLLD